MSHSTEEEEEVVYPRLQEAAQAEVEAGAVDGEHGRHVVMLGGWDSGMPPELRESRGRDVVRATELPDWQWPEVATDEGGHVVLAFDSERSMLDFSRRFESLPLGPEDVRRVGHGGGGEPSRLWQVLEPNVVRRSPARKEPLSAMLASFQPPTPPPTPSGFWRGCAEADEGSDWFTGGISEAREGLRRWRSRNAPEPLRDDAASLIWDRSFQQPPREEGECFEPEPEDKPEDATSFAALPLCWKYPEDVEEVIVAVKRAAACIAGAAVHVFGSAVNGFGDQTSDIDLVLEAAGGELCKGLNLGRCSQRELPPRALGRLVGRLHGQGFQIEERVFHAKVPILKLRFRGRECDLSCNNLLPLFNTRLLKAYADLDDRAVRILQEFKAWAKSAGAHGAYYGHLSSYAMTLMVIFFLQVRGVLPCLQSWAEQHPEQYCHGGQRLNVAMDVGVARPPQHSIDVDFRDFLRFFRDEFRWGQSVVSVRVGACQPLGAFPSLQTRFRDGITRSEAASMLHIEDPFETTRNLNCVLAPGNNELLRAAIFEAASRPAKVSVSAADNKRVWRSGGNKIRTQPVRWQ